MSKQAPPKYYFMCSHDWPFVTQLGVSISGGGRQSLHCTNSDKLSRIKYEEWNPHGILAKVLDCGLG